MRKSTFPLDPIKVSLYYPDGQFKEIGSEGCEEFDPAEITEDDMRTAFEVGKEMPMKQLWRWVIKHKAKMAPTTLVTGMLSKRDERLKVAEKRGRYKVVIAKRPLHTMQHLNSFLIDANSILCQGGYLACCSRTSSLKKQLMKKNHPRSWKLLYAVHFVWHRVFPKIKATKWLYFRMTNGHNRTFHRVELLGRLYRAGFEVLWEHTAHGEFRILAQKVKEPNLQGTPSTSPIAKLRRVGKDGKLITVYKFRTMYSYSEYLQDYVYRHRKLDHSGKFFEDYRINSIGRLLRRTWLDELPMIVNMVKGEMKLVGVRPLSEQFFSLYSPDMQALRIRTKPGLLPPLYYDKVQASTLEEIQESERRYCEAYLKNPLRTDWRYFWGIVDNILVKHRRSH